MGIPKYYRWLSERYPLTNQRLQSSEAPDIDNLYLDMNGIIHNCTHNNEGKTISDEDQMIAKIFTYLQKLIQIAKPRKILFMAIDGVAPRAKMNQQRTRRFKAAKEREEAKLKAERAGEGQPEHGFFDSNCITPGTPFMARLSEHLKYFVRVQMANDPLWQGMTVIFSGHDIPGEGEHKIMEFMRLQKLQPGYSPNERHCMYGLDADLIMLSLVTHEPHFALLREVVSYSGGNRGQPAREALDNPSANHFVLLQIGILREYIEMDFNLPNLPFEFDLERVIDDVVLFCMLVGNDFLPHSPTLDISEGAMTIMFDAYKRILPTLGGYLTNAGRLDHARLDVFIAELAKEELQTLQDRAKDAEYFESKRNKRGRDATFEVDVAALVPDDSLLGQSLGDEPGNGVDLESEILVSAEPTMMSKQARDLLLRGDAAGLDAYKSRMYRKMGADTPDKVRQSVGWFVEGLHWVLEYYYRGVPSWDWYFPFHYAPFLSDMTDLASIECSFTQGEPVLPFQQLLSVLPPQSAPLLPEPFRWLMTEERSPVARYYPREFEVDAEGKRQDWEAVVLVPFIEKALMLEAYALVDQSLLTEAERARNSHGKIAIFQVDPDSKETTFCESTLPAWGPSVLSPKSTVALRAPPPALPVGQLGFQPAVLKGCHLGKDAPKVGWPSLNVLQIHGRVQRAGINVFGMASKRESVLVVIDEEPILNEAAPDVAELLLGKRCFIRYPYLAEAKVSGVTDCESDWVSGVGGLMRVRLAPDDARAREAEAAQVRDSLLKQHGVCLGANARLFLKVRPCEGLIRSRDGVVEKRFSKEAALVPLQLALRCHPAAELHDSRLQKQIELPQLAPGDEAVFLGRTHYGALALVLPNDSAGLLADGSVKAATDKYTCEVRPLASSAALMSNQARSLIGRDLRGGASGGWMHNGALARKLGVSPASVGRLTSSLFVAVGDRRFDVGLAVRGANNLCVPDYARPAENSESGWELSEKVLALLREYKTKFGWVLHLLEGGDDRVPDVATAFPDLGEPGCMARVNAIQAWRSSTPLAARKLVPSSAKVLPEESIKSLILMIDVATRKPPGPAVVFEDVPPALLLPPFRDGGVAAALAGGAFTLCDRVVCINASGAGRPPFGSWGTVVAVYDDACEVLLDRHFEGGGTLQGRCPEGRGVLLPSSHLLNATASHPLNAVPTRRHAGPRPDNYAKAVHAAAAGPPPNGVPKVAPHAAKHLGGNGSAAKSAAAVAADVLAAVLRPAGGQDVKSHAPSSSEPPTPFQLLAHKGGAPVPAVPARDGSRGFSKGRGRGAMPGPDAPGPSAPGSLAHAASAPTLSKRAPSAADAGAQLLSMLQTAKPAAASQGAADGPPEPSTPPSERPGGGQDAPPPSPGQALLKLLRSPPPPGRAEAPGRVDAVAGAADKDVRAPPAVSGSAISASAAQESRALAAAAVLRSIQPRGAVAAAPAPASQAVLECPAIGAQKRELANAGQAEAPRPEVVKQAERGLGGSAQPGGDDASQAAQVQPAHKPGWPPSELCACAAELRTACEHTLLTRQLHPQRLVSLQLLHFSLSAIADGRFAPPGGHLNSVLAACRLELLQSFLEVPGAPPPVLAQAESVRRALTRAEEILQHALAPAPQNGMHTHALDAHHPAPPHRPLMGVPPGQVIGPVPLLPSGPIPGAFAHPGFPIGLHAPQARPGHVPVLLPTAPPPPPRAPAPPPPRPTSHVNDHASEQLLSLLGAGAAAKAAAAPPAASAAPAPRPPVPGQSEAAVMLQRLVLAGGARARLPPGDAAAPSGREPPHTGDQLFGKQRGADLLAQLAAVQGAASRTANAIEPPRAEAGSSVASTSVQQGAPAPQTSGSMKPEALWEMLNALPQRD